MKFHHTLEDLEGFLGRHSSLGHGVRRDLKLRWWVLGWITPTSTRPTRWKVSEAGGRLIAQASERPGGPGAG